MMTVERQYAELEKEGIHVLGDVSPEYAEILTPDALRFLAKLQRTHGARRKELLQARADRQKRFDAGEAPDFPEEGKAIRADESWRVAPIPEDLKCRWVEITGPASVRNMVINALNSGANAYMADFEDSDSPTWANILAGHKNLHDAVRRRIDYRDEAKGKEYRLNEKTATLLARPRGWHLPECHVEVDGEPMSGSLFDFGLYFFLNAKQLAANGSGPYFYLPKTESRFEARLWNDVFNTAQDELGVPRGTIRVTPLIETLPAAFEVEEILYELREHIIALNCGRWDYIFSYIKTLARHRDKVLPDRGTIGMDAPFMVAYQKEVLRACDKRGAYPMGGMSANIPIKNDEAANEEALAKVRADKEREVALGFYGAWAAHPGLVPIVREAYRKGMNGQPTQPFRLGDQPPATRADLLTPPRGESTAKGLYDNVKIGVEYLAFWLAGTGCVPLYDKMEDAATTEISRAQVWQWIAHGQTLSDGRAVTRELFKETLDRVMKDIREEAGEKGWASARYELAAELFEAMSASEEFAPFLTLSAYRKILTKRGK